MQKLLLLFTILALSQTSPLVAGSCIGVFIPNAATTQLVRPSFSKEGRRWVRDHVVNINGDPRRFRDSIYYFATLFIDILKRRDDRLRVLIIPKGVCISEMPGFEDLKDQKFDDKNGGKRGVDRIRSFSRANQEGLVATGAERTSIDPRASACMFHEFAHQIHRKYLTKKEDEHLQRLYRAAKRRNQFTDDYAKINYREYFAQGIEAFSIGARPKYFIAPKGADTSGTSRVNLKRVGPDLYAFIEELVGDNIQYLLPIEPGLENLAQ